MTFEISKRTFDETFEVILGFSMCGVVLAGLWIVVILIQIESNKQAFFSVEDDLNFDMEDEGEHVEGMEVEKVPPQETGGNATKGVMRGRRVSCAFKLMQVGSVCVLILLTYLLLVTTNAPLWLSGIGSLCVFCAFLRYQIGDELRRQRWDRLTLMIALFLWIASLLNLSVYSWKSLAQGELYLGPARIVGYDYSSYDNSNEHDPTTRTDIMVQWGKDWGCPLSSGKVCNAHVQGVMCQVDVNGYENAQEENDQAKANVQAYDTDDQVDGDDGGDTRRYLAGGGKNTNETATSTTTEAVEEENENLQKENEDLETENEELKKEIDELKEKEDEEEDEMDEMEDENTEEIIGEIYNDSGYIIEEEEAELDAEERKLPSRMMFVSFLNLSFDISTYIHTLKKKTELDEAEEEMDKEEIKDEIKDADDDGLKNTLDEEIDELDEEEDETIDEYEEEKEEYSEIADEYKETAEEHFEDAEEEYDEELETEDEIQDIDEEIDETEEEINETEDKVEGDGDDDWYWEEINYEYEDDAYESEYWNYDWDSAWGEYGCTDLFESDLTSAHPYDPNVQAGTDEDDWPFINIYGSCKTCEAYVLDYFAEQAFERLDDYLLQSMAFMGLSTLGFLLSIFGFIKYKISPTADNQVELLGSDGGVMA